MLEIEMKFPVACFSRVEELMQRWHAVAKPALDEADHYFNAPDRDFGKTDEAFRLRRIGNDNRITYKGPKHAGPAKTRTEIELALAEGVETAEQFCRLVEHLGYRAVAVVHKRRTIYAARRDGWDLEVCCDDVEEIGRFVEVEIVTPDERKADAEATLQRVSAELGLHESERRSYLEMLLTKRGVSG
jgi:adenylate cyclase, class 2